MMRAVDGAVKRFGYFMEQCARLDIHRMRRIGENFLVLRMDRRNVVLRIYIGEQRAAFHDVEHLQAPANGEHRKCVRFRPADKFPFNFVPVFIHSVAKGKIFFVPV